MPILESTSQITRPLLRYHGGKFLLSKWIISQFPAHRIYVEPYGGAASVLLKKPRVYAEVYNDLDGEVVNLFRICQQRGAELKEALTVTPFARKEFLLSYEPTDEAFERARRTVIRSFMGFGSAAVSMQKTGFRANSNRSGTTPAKDWLNFPDALDAIIDRLRGVVIENRNALDVMAQHDTENTLHFLDPPYVLDTRYRGQSTKAYKYEMSNQQHEQMCVFIKSLKGMVFLSGYDNEIYNDILADWTKVRRKAFADGARVRTEILWLSPTADIF